MLDKEQLSTLELFSFSDASKRTKENTNKSIKTNGKKFFIRDKILIIANLIKKNILSKFR